MSRADGETDAFYQWVIDQAQKRGDPPATDREKRLPLRARAYGAAAYLIGAESADAHAPPRYNMCAAELFDVLREAWAAGANAPTKPDLISWRDVTCVVPFVCTLQGSERIAALKEFRAPTRTHHVTIFTYNDVGIALPSWIDWTGFPS